MTKAEQALAYFKGSFNCAQSVFSTFAPELGLDLETAWRVATPFGGGLSHMREVCGAVSGALMVIGLAHGMSNESDQQAKEKSYALAKEFTGRFTARHQSINCYQLIGFDLDNPEEYERAKAEGVFDTTCTHLVKDAVEILEEIL
jgi:C_GCAxxG_C_C family probable redox protein